jgi:UDP-N-acetylglucosamine/UDP-N-acetylgalactosamine diphosphorylase
MAVEQGTCLGSSVPGMLRYRSPIISQYKEECIGCLQQVAQEETGKPIVSVVVPWYIMTSGPTRLATEEFPKTNAYFGLKPENIFFKQGACRFVGTNVH